MDPPIVRGLLDHLTIETKEGMTIETMEGMTELALTVAVTEDMTDVLRGIDAEFLLRVILRWYANPRSWEKRTGYSGSTLMSTDAGRIARRALDSGSIGDLLVSVCDAHEIALTDLGRRAGITDSRIGEICRRTELTPDESYRLRLTVEIMTGNV